MNSETTSHQYQSLDGLITIGVLTNPQRWPRHDYKCCVVTVKPRNHERVRTLVDGNIELMFTKQELKALVLCWSKCDPDFGVTFTTPMHNKPEVRRAKWKNINQKRISQGRFYRSYRASRH